MNYIHRSLERKFLKMNSFFKVILVTGARQVGKTTMLRHLAEGEKRTYVSMDDMMARSLAQQDPVLFFQTFQPPIMIDEVQKAPQLFDEIKRLCDASEETGKFWLTGSQQYGMVKHARESLAGRIGILQLYGLSWLELYQQPELKPLDFSLQNLLLRQQQFVEQALKGRGEKPAIRTLFDAIWRGSMPQLQEADAEERHEYFNSYVDTYLMRDAVEAGGISDTLRFQRFLKACAAFIGEQLNLKTLAEAADIAQPTAKEWLRVLQGLGIIYLLQPYSNNELKRLAKTPKLYFCDTGLCAWLSMWLTPETLMEGAASGHFFENFVVMELVKQYAYGERTANLSYYRDSNAKEVDIIVEADGCLHPLEVKKSAAPDRREVKKYELLDKASQQRGTGGIICMCEQVIPIDENNQFIPCWIL